MIVLGAEVLPRVLPAVAPDEAPWWRQCLRGFSQCAFQCNELTALAFIAAAGVYDWRMMIFYVISVILGTLIARLLGGDRVLLGLGLFGFNSGLMGLALGNFFVHDTALWIAVPILAGIVAAVTVAAARWLPIPFLAAPFIATFWVLWPMRSAVGLTAVNLGAFGNSRVQFFLGTLHALGSTLFAVSTATGILFLLGVLVASWRQGIVAVLGGLVAVLLGAHVGVPGDMINSGFIGFNAVLAALATYELLGADLRLVFLASMASTWFFAFINANWPAPALASGFVICVWVIMFLGWLNSRFTPVAVPSEPEAGMESQPEAAAPPVPPLPGPRAPAPPGGVASRGQRTDPPR
jgi:urea transporter